MILLEIIKTRIALARRIKLLEETLKETGCPRPANGQPWDQCAGDCIKLGLCGCHVGAALGVQHNDGGVA